MTVMRAAYPRVSYADLERAPEDGHRYDLPAQEALAPESVQSATLSDLALHPSKEFPA